MSKTVVVKSLMILLATLVLAFVYYQQALKQPLDVPSDGVIIEVRTGQSLSSVLTRLQERGILAHQWIARLYARQNSLAGQIKAGEFRLGYGSTIPELFSALVSNDRIQYRIIFVEGSSFAEARDALRNHEKLTQTLNDQSDEAVLARLRTYTEWPSEHPEGSIYPDTYFFRKGDSDWSILLRAHRRLNEVLQEEWSKRDEAAVLDSPYEALILASIVEKETGHPDERDEIAGVFTRRLEKGMRLQTDPTVIYGLGERYQGNLTRAHLRERTAYNTYRINGLPPTPIALAGRAAIHAVLHPAEGDTLYFVAKGDGSHYFSRTITEHNQAVRKFQLSRRQDYRSSHQPSAKEVN